MSKNPKYPPCPPDFEDRILEATGRPNPPTVPQFLEELYPHYDLAAVRDWDNARWRLFGKHVDAINSRRESEGQPLLPKLPGQRQRRRGRDIAHSLEVREPLSCDHSLEINGIADVKYARDAEPTITDLFRVKELAEQKDSVEGLAKQLSDLGEIADQVGGFEKLRKCLEAMQKLGQ